MVFLYTGVPFSVLFCVLLLKCSDFQQFLTIKRSSATLNRTEPSPNYHLHFLSFSFFDMNDFTLKWSKVQRLKTDNAKTQCFTRCQDLKKKKKLPMIKQHHFWCLNNFQQSFLFPSVLNAVHFIM